jgi:HlyD family secretion protein
VKKSILFSGLGASALALAVTFAFKSEPKASPGPVPSLTVGVVLPESATFARTIAATGTVSARDELLIGSDAAGARLVEVLVDVGSPVKKGQLLASADDRQLQAQLAQQRATLRQAQAEAAQAQANLERAERLTDFYSVEAVQTRRTSAATAQAKVELAAAQLDELQVKIDHTRVHAPADGVISRRAATVGAVVQSGTELFRLIRGGELEWRAELPSHSLALVSPGAAVRLLIDNGDAIAGTVRMVAPTMDSATRNGIVYVSFKGQNHLKAGAHARGEVILEAAESLSLPDASVLSKDGYPVVFTVGADNIARLTRVATGNRQGGRVEISAGLRAGERVVGAGAGFVKDGDLVRIGSKS